jgi:branched-chain amino acid transport system ATP-binding protein
VPTAEESDGALTVREISVSFGGITALSDVSLAVSAGEVLGVIGPNGAGKTTLFNVICGFVAPDAGTLTWRGRPLTAIRPHRLASLGIARTLQGVGLFPHLTVQENVMVGAQRFRRSGLAGALLALPRSDRDERALRDRATAALQQLDCADVPFAATVFRWPEQPPVRAPGFAATVARVRGNRPPHRHPSVVAGDQIPGAAELVPQRV